MQVRLSMLCCVERHGGARAESPPLSGLGLQRWTDGRRWSCSRVMGEFLAYDEVRPLPFLKLTVRPAVAEARALNQVVPCGGPSAKRSG